MYTIIDAAFTRARSIAIIFIMLLIAGASSYFSIPKEAEPDVTIPIVYVSVGYDGISPEDGERLLIRPLEKELQSIAGLREMKATGSQGFASVTLEFDAGFDADQALLDVREKVDRAKAELPPGSDEPRVTEVNVSLFPVLTVVLSGDLPERSLLNIAQSLKDEIEALSGVLEVNVGGDREELLEVVVDPIALETYQLSFTDVFNFVSSNNRLVAAGALDTGAGRMVFKVPGVIETMEDLSTLPVKRVGDTIVTFADVASIRRTFKDPTTFARIQGEQALVLEISKRSGANIIETVDQVRAVVTAAQQAWPSTVSVRYLQDKSDQIKTMLGDLENNVMTAIVLVMIVIVAALGVRPSILVGLAIPGSFLAAMVVINFFGFTLNIVVLFALILVVGMLVDGAIVTIELADRYMQDGESPKTAFASASKRMSWPIIASTVTTLVVFAPLLVWPGLVGEFMKFLPITVIITLIASLFMALIFIPVLGSVITRSKDFTKDKHDDSTTSADIRAAQKGDLESIKGWVGRYLNILNHILRHPGKSVSTAVVALLIAYIAYFTFGKGVEFFPEIEPEFIQVQVQARGDLSIVERDALVAQVENIMLSQPHLDSVYTKTMGAGMQSQSDMPEDVVGVIQLELSDWQTRPPADQLIEGMRDKVANIAGINVQIRKQESGPSAGKPIQLDINAQNPSALEPAVMHVRKLMEEIGGFEDVEDSRPLPSIEWRLKVNRELAAKYNVDVTLLGNAVTLITNGALLAEYRPDDVEDEVEIRLRFPLESRNLEQLYALTIPTNNGLVPIRNFVSFEPAQKMGRVSRTDGQRAMSIKSNVADDLLPDAQVKELRAALMENPLPRGVTLKFKGQDEDSQEAMGFLTNAFIASIFLMLVILVTQFNSFYQAFIVLSAIVFSTAGVLLGLLATGQAFGIVMGGIGVIALAGIVVNNNIVLIDTYNDLVSQGVLGKDAILRTCAQRIRPVLLTSVTTILGLMPMVFALTINILERDISIGAPSAQWWTMLASTIAGGLTFATVLTLFVTPSLLMLADNIRTKKVKSTTTNPPSNFIEVGK
ncbi:efflux RND transporter permease subunit [Glaciecola sp. XM2]|uniref:efflux RND transporter permease subunit n=1 Tax=Glaciecola sp. XM2 TaxID=1914931 RepID=UPI001BDE12D5|nr:efflux RND transporter permease subunit [Glaciecola sp. XM2]MBT1452441.1 efflux RND transporter permease subunit [Glaciecola sp. XM2]